jgi:hypothetical protein
MFGTTKDFEPIVSELAVVRLDTALLHTQTQANGKIERDAPAVRLGLVRRNVLSYCPRACATSQ